MALQSIKYAGNEKAMCILEFLGLLKFRLEIQTRRQKRFIFEEYETKKGIRGKMENLRIEKICTIDDEIGRRLSIAISESDRRIA